MHLFNLLFLSLFTLTVSAEGDHKGHNGIAALGEHKGNGTAKDSTKFECAEIERLTSLTDLVNNSTKFASFSTHHNLSAADQAKLQAKAANATTKLTTLQSNATLVSACATIDAAQKLKMQCKEMKALTKLTDVANNATALAELQSKHNLTAAQVQKIKNEAANATTKLNKLKGNSTLVTACEDMKDGDETGSSGTTKTATSGAQGVGGGLLMVLLGVVMVMAL